MKNTKHNEFLDQNSSNPEISSSKRKILTSLGVSSGILGASALSQHWVKPVVNSVILPAHAQTTPGETTTTTTAAPAPMPMIVLSPMALGVINASGEDATSRTHLVAVRLSMAPTGPVTVSASGATVTGLGSDNSFTTTSWNQDKVATVVIPRDTTVASMAAEEEAKVTFTASGTNSGYTDVKAELTYTAGYFSTDAVAGDVEAEEVSFGSRSATVTWTAPKTRATVAGYRVSSDQSGVTSQTVTGTSVTFTELSQITHTFTVQVLYRNAAGTVVDGGGTAGTDSVVIN